MSSGNADILAAVYRRWVADGLDWEFKKHWRAALRDEFPALHNTEAGPSTPRPYCVFRAEAPTVAARMTAGPKTGGSVPRREQHEHPYEFRVHATPQGDLGGDEVAAAFIDILKQKFGGHPTIAPTGELSLTHGGVVVVQYVTDYGTPEADGADYLWVLKYNIRADVPVAA